MSTASAKLESTAASLDREETKLLQQRFLFGMSSILGSQTLHADPNSPIYNSKSLSYDASKAALNSFTIHLAQELRDTKIKVNSAHPGWVKTDMGGAAAPMEIPDGAKTGVALALAGDDAPTGGYFHLGKSLPW